MDIDTAKQRIDSAINQYGAHAAPAIELVLNEADPFCYGIEK